MIRGHGNPPIKAFFIGDGGVGDDLRTNYAISGYAEKLLGKFCTQNSLHIDNFYKTLLIKEELKTKPIKIKTEDYIKANAEDVAKYSSILIDEINTLKPDLLIPLGELSFNYITSLKGIRKFRGSILPPSGPFSIEHPNTKVLPILGPYPYLYTEYRLQFITQVDFQKIPQYLNDRPIPDKFFNLWICKTAGALREYFKRHYSEDGVVVFDIETYLGIPTCISFCFDGFESVCVPLLDSEIDIDNRVLMWMYISKLLASPMRKVNQNIKYDWRILERWGFTVNNVSGDTQLAAGTIYCEFPKNLGFLVSIYTDLPYFKDEGKEFDPTRYKKEMFYMYNAKDSLGTFQVYQKQMAEVVETGVSYVYNSLIELLPIYKKSEERGILVDNTQHCKLLGKYTSLYEIEKIKLQKLLGEQYVNPLSSTQMQRVVYDDLGYQAVRGVKKGKSGADSADEDSLVMLRINGEATRSPSLGPIILDTIINCRKLHKVIEILETPLYPDGRLRQDTNLSGTETGRSTGGRTIDELLIFDEKEKLVRERLGHSLQTIGKHGFDIDGIVYGRDIRSQFVPTPGYSFVEIDLAGAEARVDAVLAGIFDLSYFDNPGIHKLTGSWCFDCKPEEIDKKTLVPFGDMMINRYHVAKQVRHAGERNIQAPGLVTKLLWGFTVRQGEELLKKFHKYQPEIKQVYHRDIIKAVDTTRALVCPNGRRRDFFDRINQSVYNQAISQMPQAIVSDQTKFHGILKTSKMCEWAYLISEAHDGVLYEVPKGRELEFIEIYKKNIEVPIDFRNCSLPRDYQLIIPAEASIGGNWFEMEDVKC